MRMRIWLICNEMRGFGLDKQVWLENRDFSNYRRSHVPEAGHGAPDFVPGFRKGNPWIRMGGAFSSWAVALSAPRALPWAGIGARRWRLRPSAGCVDFWGASQLRFSQTDPLPILPHSTALRVRMTSSLCRLSYLRNWARLLT